MSNISFSLLYFLVLYSIYLICFSLLFSLLIHYHLFISTRQWAYCLVRGTGAGMWCADGLVTTRTQQCHVVGWDFNCFMRARGIQQAGYQQQQQQQQG
jgi:hypothetical protein